MRLVDRDLIRGGHYGQRSCEPQSTGRTHGCSDQCLRLVKKTLANSEPFHTWPLSSFTALQKCGRYRINSGQTAPSCSTTGSAAFDPQRTCASDPVRDRIWWPCVQELWGEGRVLPVDAGKLTGEPHLLRPARIIVVSNAKRIARVLVAGRIGVISAYGAVVITRDTTAAPTAAAPMPTPTPRRTYAPR